MMMSFYYFNLNPLEFCFLVQITLGFCYLSLTETTKFKYEKKNKKDSSHSSTMMPSFKWPIACFQSDGTRGKSPCIIINGII